MKRRLTGYGAINEFSMKLKSIKTIKDYKSFRDFSWRRFFNGEAFHDGVNLLYGENGSGKSSIVNLLKSVSENKDFGEHKPTEVCLVFNDHDEKKYVNNNWDEKIAKKSILFFDREFVDKNVHLGHKRDTTQEGQEQISGKMIIEFDSKAIKLRSDREAAKKARTEFRAAHTASLYFVLDEDEGKLYHKYKDKNDEEIKKAKQELGNEKKEVEKRVENDQELLKKASTIQNYIKTLETKEPELSLADYETYQAIFSFGLKEQTKIKAKQTLINKIKTYKDFFETGFNIRTTHPGQCPFCQSENEEEGIQKVVDLYKQIYDTTYKKQVKQFKKGKQSLLDEISQITQTLSGFALDKIFLKLKKLDQNYKIPDIYSVEDEEAYNKPGVKALEELNSKIANLTEPNQENIQELYDKAKTEFEAAKAFYKKISDFVDQQNKLITKFRSDNTYENLQSRITSNKNRIVEIDKELNFINEDKINKAKEAEDLQEKWDLLEKKDNIASQNYEEYCSKEVFSNLLSKIEYYFKKFNFNFELKLKKERTGRKTELPFAFQVLDLQRNERDLEEGLSEGEIHVLSLCFFFAFLDIQEIKNQKLLVFDDPITSLDNSNLSRLVDLIAVEQENFSQTFIFTHHKDFFKLLRKRFNRHYDEYNLIRNKKEFGASFICQSKSKKILDKLKKFEKYLCETAPKGVDIESTVVEYGQYLRYEVERYIKNDLLHWNDANNFQKVIEGVKRNKEIDDGDLDKIKQIYSFCNWTTSHVDVGDEHGLVQLKSKIADFVSIFK